MCLTYSESPLPGSSGALVVSGAQTALTTSVSSMITVAATASPDGLALNLAYVERAVPRERVERMAQLIVESLAGAAAPDGARLLAASAG